MNFEKIIRKDMMRILIMFSLFVALLCTGATFAQGDFMEKFGISEGNSVDEGFVFINGRYVEPPYVVSRRGLELFINNKKVKRPARHPGGKPYVGDAPLSELTDEAREKLSRLLEATRGIYESNLQKGCCYFFSSHGGHIRLDPYNAAYELPKVIEVLQSDSMREVKLAELKARNWHLAASVDNIVDRFSAPPELLIRLNQQAQELLRVNEFGAAVGPPILSGFVFYDGRYLDSPYTVERRGLGLFINGQLVESPMKWPVDIASSNVDPELPSEINSETSIFDDIFTRYWQQKEAYLTKHHSREQARRVMEQVFRSLPFVTDVTIDGKDPFRLYVSTSDGQTRSVYLLTSVGRQRKCIRKVCCRRLKRSERPLKMDLRKAIVISYLAEEEELFSR